MSTLGGSSLHFQSALLPQGWQRDVRLEIDQGVITGIESGVAARPGDTLLRAGLAGLPNLHSHAFQRGMAGLSEYRSDREDTFWTWRELMYRFLAHLTPDDVEAISALAYIEMLESGFTRVGEFHYLHHDPHGRPYADPAEMTRRIAAAAERTGIALTLLPVFYAHAGFGGTAPASGQRRFVSDLDGYARLLEASRALAAKLPDGRAGIAPHSLRAVTPDELGTLLSFVQAGESIHIHAAEQLREVEECLAWSGRRPVEWLLAEAPIDPRFCLVHATHLTREETLQLAQRGAVAGLCPVTEQNLGDGIFRAVEFRGAGGTFGIGTDSNVRIDAAQELCALEYSQRLQHRGRNLLADAHASTGRALYASALAGGGRALGIEAGIALGLPADLISLDLDRLEFVGRVGDALLDSWIFSGARGCIDGVWRGGVQLVAQGKHRDRERIEANYRATLTRLLAA